MQSTQENTRFIDIFSPFPCIYHMTNIDPMLFVNAGKAQNSYLMSGEKPTWHA